MIRSYAINSFDIGGGGDFSARSELSQLPDKQYYRVLTKTG